MPLPSSPSQEEREESQMEVEKAVLETVDKLTGRAEAELLDKVEEEKQNVSMELGELGKLVIADIPSSAECSKSNSPMSAEMAAGGNMEVAKAPENGQITSRLAPAPPLVPAPKAMAPIITLKKMPIQPSPVAKILPKPFVPRAVQQQQKNVVPAEKKSKTPPPPAPRTPPLPMEVKPKLVTVAPKLIRVRAAANSNNEKMAPGLVRLPMQNVPMPAVQNQGHSARPQLVPIRPKMRAAVPMPTPPNANGSPKAETGSTTAAAEDHLAATVDKVAAGKEISPKKEEEKPAPPVPVVPAPSKSKSRKKKPPVVPAAPANQQPPGPPPMAQQQQMKQQIPADQAQMPPSFMIQTKGAAVPATFGPGNIPQQMATSGPGIFAQQSPPQFALAPNGNLVALSAGGMTHFLIRQQPSSGQFIPFMPSGQLFLSPIQPTMAADPGKSAKMGGMVAQGSQQLQQQQTLAPAGPSPSSLPAPQANKQMPSIAAGKMPPTSSNLAIAAPGGQQTVVVDEEENEPPPVLDKTTSHHHLHPEEQPSGGPERLLESIFQKEAKIIREKFFGPAGKKMGPIVHEIDGFRIEEDIEPFAVENKKLLDTLKGGENSSPVDSPLEEKDKKLAQKEKKRKVVANASRSPSPKRGKSPFGISSTSSKASSKKAAAEKVPLGKGGKRELKSLLEMDFGPGKTPFQTSDPDEYAEEVMIEARKHARLMSEERPLSSISSSSRAKQQQQRGDKERSLVPTPNQQQSKSEKRSPNQPKDLAREPRSSGEYETDDEGRHCHNCRRSFREVGRYQGHEQYCSRECYKTKKRLKKLKKTSREEGQSGGTGNSNNAERSPPTPRHSDPMAAASSTPTTAPPQKWTSPLGSAFSSVQSQQLAGQMLGGPLGGSPSNGGDQSQCGQGQPMFLASSSQHHQPQQMMAQMPAHLMAAPQYAHHPAAAYFHHQFVHPQAMMAAAAAASAVPSTSAFFANQQFHQMMPPQQPMLRSPHLVQSPPVTPGTPLTPLGRNADVDMLLAKGIHNWTPDEVAKWVNFVTNSLANGEPFVEQEIDGSCLLLLTCEQLQNELKLKLGPAVKLQNALNALKSKSAGYMIG